MHGLQYIVMVRGYMGRADREPGRLGAPAHRLFAAGHTHWFLATAALYAVAYQLLVGASLLDFGFGFLGGVGTEAAATAEIPLMTQVRVVLVAESAQLLHFYFDSFVWKVRDQRTQSAL